jgi:small subunit ribosomal protein S21
MLIVNVEKTGSLDRALKQLKKKFQSTGVVEDLRARKEFKKPCVKRRDVMKKAAYIQKHRDEELK